MDLCRIDLDERTRKEIRLLLVVPLQSHGIARLDKRLQCLDDRAGFQHRSLHPGRDAGQASGLLRPAARPTALLSVEPDGSIHFSERGHSVFSFVSQAHLSPCLLVSCLHQWLVYSGL